MLKVKIVSRMTPKMQQHPPPAGGIPRVVIDLTGDEWVWLKSQEDRDALDNSRASAPAEAHPPTKWFVNGLRDGSSAHTDSDQAWLCRGVENTGQVPAGSTSQMNNAVTSRPSKKRKADGFPCR
jgi:hypothetical protein